MLTKDQLTTIHEALEYTRSLTQVKGFAEDCAELVPIVQGLIDNPHGDHLTAYAEALPEQVQHRETYAAQIQQARDTWVWVALGDTTCPTCGEDGGTSCGSPTCGLLQGG